MEAWAKRFQQEQMGFRVAGGAYDTPDKTPAIGVYVHRDNPLRNLSLPQLDALYSSDRLRGASAPITRWGEFEYTRENVLRRDYPLSRVVYIHVNKDPSKPWDPKVREFLSFVPSREGQQCVADAGVFTPLPEAILEQERAKLER
jgi:ABC-type phosphate transport system substrate-binding protein